MSLSHINQSFNEEVQVDFYVGRIRDINHVILNIVDCGTKFGFRTIVQNRSLENMQHLFETNWIFIYGALKSFSVTTNSLLMPLSVI